MELDEAIKHCEEKAKELREQPFKEKMDIEDVASCEECAEEHEQLVEWLEDYKRLLEERPQGEWIPVSERLPEENGEYLVTREAYIDRENRNMIIVRDISYFTTNYGLNNGFHKANTVIAWQPLPEPYKEGGAE